MLLIRASRGREVLAERLIAGGAVVEQVVAYGSRDVPSPDAEIAELLRQDRIDWVTVTSSAIARSLAALFGEDLRRARLASISPVTSAALRTCGYEPAVEAATYTMDGVVEAIAQSDNRHAQ
ncbi:MAG: uroporphyrinogen-III synthase [Acetobacteraceae bacterium]